MRFVLHPEYIDIAFKAHEFSGNFGGVGPAAAGGTLAFCSVSIQERYFNLFLYDDEGRTTNHRYNFADLLPLQDDGSGKITQIDVTGNPVVVIHDGVVKVFFAMYRDGPEPEQLFRFNTGYRLES